jgi:citrate/tricarballylate utilization protein
MVVAFGTVFLFDVVALAIATMRFWRTLDAGRVSGSPLAEATRDALSLRYLDGGHGEGCNESDDRFTRARRRFHHFAFYGFLLCFASTCVATLYHYGLSWPAPYPLTSTPVLLGIAGGIAMVVGCGGLLVLHVRRHPLHRDPAQAPMDLGFIALLLLTAATGLALTALRDTAAMAVVLAVHLGIVMALFLTLPYGKFAHGFYRSAALLKYAIERRQPPRLDLGPD